MVQRYGCWLSVQVFRDVALVDGKDSEFEFPVPYGVRRVSFALAAKVKLLATGTEQVLSSSMAMDVNGIDATPCFVDVHMRQEDDGCARLL